MTTGAGAYTTGGRGARRFDTTENLVEDRKGAEAEGRVGD